MPTTFIKLSTDWNAEPNAPNPFVTISGRDLLLSFHMNAFRFPRFKEEDIGILRFSNCWRYRLGPTNDEGWYKGQCRFSKLAPGWGEFYEVSGDVLFEDCPDDWIDVGPKTSAQKHFLFYLRDNQFEVDAESWTLDVQNLLERNRIAKYLRRS